MAVKRALLIRLLFDCLMTKLNFLLEGERQRVRVRLQRAAEERDGESDGPRPRSRAVELGHAPEALGGRRLDGGGAVGHLGQRQRR